MAELGEGMLVGEPVPTLMSHSKDPHASSGGRRVGRTQLQPSGLLVWWGDPATRWTG